MTDGRNRGEPISERNWDVAQEVEVQELRVEQIRPRRERESVSQQSERSAKVRGSVHWMWEVTVPGLSAATPSP